MIVSLRAVTEDLHYGYVAAREGRNVEILATVSWHGFFLRASRVAVPVAWSCVSP
jgi:hypothetical protein